MVKYFTLITPGPKQEAAAFRQWFLREHAPTVLRHCPGLRRYVVNLREPAPSIDNMPHFEPGGAVRRRYQVVTQMSLDSAIEFTDRERRYDSSAAGREIEADLTSRVGESFTYRVTE